MTIATALINQLKISTPATFKAAGNFKMAADGICVVKKTVAAATQVTLPAYAKSGDFAFVKDGSGNAATYNITVIPDGTTNNTTIDGGANTVINVNYGVCIFMHNGVEWNLISGYPGTGAASFTNVTLTGLLNESAADALTAVGTNQATALALTNEVNRVTTGASTTGVALPAAAAGLSILVINSVANSIHVYGNNTAADTINDVATATGIVQPGGSVVLYVCSVAGKWYTEGIGGGYAGSLATFWTVGAISAAGTTLGTATALTAMVNRVTTCAANAGVSLPANALGLSIEVTNDGANALSVYPDVVGATINSLAAGTATLLPVGQTAVFCCEVGGASAVWKTTVFPPRESLGTLTTAGAGTVLAPTIAGGLLLRTGATSAFNDTTDTASLIIAQLHGAAIGQSWEFTYQNSTYAVATLIGGTGVNSAGTIGIVGPGSWCRFLVTYTAAATVTFVPMAAGDNWIGLPSTAYNTGTTTGTFTAAQMTGSGAKLAIYQSTAATPGSIATPTATAMFAAIPGAYVGLKWIFRVINDVATNSMTITADGSVTLSGKTTYVATPFCSMDFEMTFTSVSAATMKYIGSGQSTTV